MSKLAKRNITEQICETHLFLDQTSEAAAAAAEAAAPAAPAAPAAAREEFTKKPHG